MIPTFLIVQHLGLVDSLGALIAPNLVTPFGIFLLRQFFRTLPIELEEAARIDGCSRLGVLFRVVLPLSMPALATLADRHVPVDVERLPVAADRHLVDRPEHGAARPGVVPGRAPDQLDAADGRQRDGARADAARVRRSPSAGSSSRSRRRGSRDEPWRGRVPRRDEGVRRRHDGRRRARPRRRRRRADGAGRAVGLRQVDRASDGGRSRAPDRGLDRDRRPRRRRPLAGARATSRWSSRATPSTRT